MCCVTLGSCGFPSNLASNREHIIKRATTYTYTLLVSAPDPHVTPSRKRVWYLTSDFLVVLSQHVNVNCVIRPDNHVILYQFASSISGLPVRACACRAALPFCHMIVSNPAIWLGYPFSEHADSAQRTRFLRAPYIWDEIEIDAHGVYTRGPYNNVWKGVGSLPYPASTVLCSISFKSFQAFKYISYVQSVVANPCITGKLLAFISKASCNARVGYYWLHVRNILTESSWMIYCTAELTRSKAANRLPSIRYYMDRECKRRARLSQFHLIERA